MVSTLFVLLYFMSPFFLFWLYRLSGFNVREVNIINLVVFSFFVFAYVGVLPLYFYWDEYRYVVGVVDRDIIISIFFASLWSFFAIILIFSLWVRVLFVPARRCAGVDMRPFNHMESLVCALAYLICGMAFLLYMRSVDQVALFVALFETQEGVARARSSMTNAFDGRYHWYRLLISDFSVFLSYCFYANYLKVKSRMSLGVFSVTFLLCCLFLLSSAQKAPVVWYFLGLYLVYSVVVNKGIVSFKGGVFLGVSGLGVLVVLFVVFMGVEDFSLAVASVFSRLFTAGISASYFYIKFFPDVEGFLWGRSLPNPGGIFPFDPYPLTKKIMDWRFAGNMERGVVGSSPTVFWGEAYANFSWFGVFFIPFLIGSVIYLYHYFVSFLEDTPFKVALTVWLALFFKDVSVTGFSAFLINVTLFSFVFLVLFLVVLSNKLSFKIIR